MQSLGGVFSGKKIIQSSFETPAGFIGVVWENANEVEGLRLINRESESGTPPPLSPTVTAMLYAKIFTSHVTS